MNSHKNILELLSTDKRKIKSYCIYNVKKHVIGTLYVYMDTCLEVEEQEVKAFR